jgi:hypothetical protein
VIELSAADLALLPAYERAAQPRTVATVSARWHAVRTRRLLYLVPITSPSAASKAGALAGIASPRRLTIAFDAAWTALKRQCAASNGESVLVTDLPVSLRLSAALPHLGERTFQQLFTKMYAAEPLRLSVLLLGALTQSPHDVILLIEDDLDDSAASRICRTKLLGLLRTFLDQIAEQFERHKEIILESGERKLIRWRDGPVPRSLIEWNELPGGRDVQVLGPHKEHAEVPCWLPTLAWSDAEHTAGVALVDGERSAIISTIEEVLFETHATVQTIGTADDVEDLHDAVHRELTAGRSRTYNPARSSAVECGLRSWIAHVAKNAALGWLGMRRKLVTEIDTQLAAAGTARALRLASPTGSATPDSVEKEVSALKQLARLLSRARTLGAGGVAARARSRGRWDERRLRRVLLERLYGRRTAVDPRWGELWVSALERGLQLALTAAADPTAPPAVYGAAVESLLVFEDRWALRPILQRVFDGTRPLGERQSALQKLLDVALGGRSSARFERALQGTVRGVLRAVLVVSEPPGRLRADAALALARRFRDPGVLDPVIAPFVVNAHRRLSTFVPTDPMTWEILEHYRDRPGRDPADRGRAPLSEDDVEHKATYGVPYRIDYEDPVQVKKAITRLALCVFATEAAAARAMVTLREDWTGSKSGAIRSAAKRVARHRAQASFELAWHLLEPTPANRALRWLIYEILSGKRPTSAARNDNEGIPP